VVSDATTVQVQLPVFGQMVFEAYVPLICHHFDLAVVRLVDPPSFREALEKQGMVLEPVPIVNMSISLGLEVAAVGFPLGTTSLKLSRGIISGTEHVNGGFCYQSTAPISPGSSGGPLFALDRDGKKRGVVGVNFATSSKGNAQNANYVVPTLHMRQILSELRTQEANKSADSKSHAQMLVAPLQDIEVEANEALYSTAHGCDSGVYLSRILPKSVLVTADPPVEPRSFITNVDGIELDSYGMGSVPGFSGEQSPFGQLLVMLRTSIDDIINVTSCKDGALTTHALSMRQRPEHFMGVREIQEPHFQEEALDYESFAGVTVMQMNLNHVAMLASRGATSLGRWLLPENQVEPRLMVSHVTPGTYASRVLAEGMVVAKVNGHEVSTLADFRSAFDSNSTSWVLETDREVLYHVDFEKMLTEQLMAGTSPQGRYLLRPALLSAAAARNLVDIQKPAMIQIDKGAVHERHAERSSHDASSRRNFLAVALP
jgi:S1-C subfamily serine protease